MINFKFETNNNQKLFNTLGVFARCAIFWKHKFQCAFVGHFYSILQLFNSNPFAEAYIISFTDGNKKTFTIDLKFYKIM